MSQYRTFKTTMGNKIRVRMTEEEIAERDLFRIALVVFPFLASVVMFFLWVKLG